MAENIFCWDETGARRANAQSLKQGGGGQKKEKEEEGDRDRDPSIKEV